MRRVSLSLSSPATTRKSCGGNRLAAAISTKNPKHVNKADEWKLLKAAMLPGDAEGATEHEAPDFLVPRPGVVLGVEVTEAFISESHARMELLPGYMGELLKEHRYRHKKDKAVYPIKRVQYTARDGSPIEGIGVVSAKPNSSERCSRLANVIARKASPVQEYLKECGLVDLIVRDRGIFSGQITKQQIPQIYQHPELRKAVQSSGFHEIFYVAQANDGKTFSYPARSGILAEEALRFFNVLGSVAPQAAFPSVAGALNLHLANSGFRSVAVYEQPPERLCILCDVAVATFETSNLHIYIHDLYSDAATEIRSRPGDLGSLLEGKSLLDSLEPEMKTASFYVDIARKSCLKAKLEPIRTVLHSHVIHRPPHTFYIHFTKPYHWSARLKSA